MIDKIIFKHLQDTKDYALCNYQYHGNDIFYLNRLVDADGVRDVEKRISTIAYVFSLFRRAMCLTIKRKYIIVLYC
jgi:hypothetical protein